MSALIIYEALSLFILFDLLIKHYGTDSKVHFFTSFIIAHGWPVWVLGACQIVYQQVDILTKQKERK